MSKPSTNIKRQSNGFVGEMKTAGLLGRHFIVLKKSVDEDGADFLVDLQNATPAQERARSKGIRIFGVVQAKYAEFGRSVYIEPSYVMDGLEPRRNFFLIVHSEDEDWNHIHYFLTADDIRKLPLGKNRKYRFDVKDKKASLIFKNIPPRAIITTMKGEIAACERSAGDDFVNRLFLSLHMRASFEPRDKTMEYHLKRIALSGRDGTGEAYEARAVFARSSGISVPRPIDARVDLRESKATWDWGYKGGGPQLLAMSILAHYMGWETKPTDDEFRAFLEFIKALERDSDHVITGAGIETALSSAGC